MATQAQNPSKKSEKKGKATGNWNQYIYFNVDRKMFR